jgi:hypothetical protein
MWWLSAVVAGLLSACGGGGGGGTDETPVQPILQSPPVTGAPTAVLAATSQTAASLVTASQAGASAVDKVDGFSSLPLGVQVAPPSGVTSTETLACSGGGNMTGTVDAVDPNQPAVGDSAKLQFSNCVEMNVSFSGSVAVRITRYRNDNDFAAAFSVAGLLVTESGLTRGPLSFAGQVDESAAGISFAYEVDQQAVVGDPLVSRSGSTVTVDSATTRSYLGSTTGFVEVRLSHWVFNRDTGRPSAGTASVTGANGNSATVTVQADGYHVGISVGGVVSNLVVPF